MIIIILPFNIGSNINIWFYRNITWISTNTISNIITIYNRVFINKTFFFADGFILSNSVCNNISITIIFRNLFVVRPGICASIFTVITFNSESMGLTIRTIYMKCNTIRSGTVFVIPIFPNDVTRNSRHSLFKDSVNNCSACSNSSRSIRYIIVTIIIGIICCIIS